MRRIIQLQVIPAVPPHNVQLKIQDGTDSFAYIKGSPVAILALCDDGTWWEYSQVTNFQWEEQQPMPQEVSKFYVSQS